MPETVYRYTLYCETEEAWKFVWASVDDPVPDKCPTNTAHTIVDSSISVVETIEEQEVVVQEENVTTGDHYQGQSFELEVPAETGIHSLDVSFPFPVSIAASEFSPQASMEGDIVDFCVAPDTVIGAITADVAATNVWITVQQSVIDNTSIGYYIELNDGTNSDDLGRVVEIDTVNLKIKVETAATQTFLAATPTYVKQTVKMIPHIYLQDGGRVRLGQCMIRSSYIPTGTVLRTCYDNISGTAKIFSFIFEYRY